MSRYRVEQDWRTIRSTTVTRNSDGTDYRVVHEAATLVDTRGGYRYEDGAHRVRLVGPAPLPYRAKTWKGETAWSHAESYWRDLIYSVERAVAVS